MCGVHAVLTIGAPGVPQLVGATCGIQLAPPVSFFSLCGSLMEMKQIIHHSLNFKIWAITLLALRGATAESTLRWLKILYTHSGISDEVSVWSFYSWMEKISRWLRNTAHLILKPIDLLHIIWWNHSDSLKILFYFQKLLENYPQSLHKQYFKVITSINADLLFLNSKV